MLDAPTVPRWTIAKNAADNLTKPFHEPPVPVKEIAESQQLDVVFVDFGEFQSTVAGALDFEGQRILVNNSESFPRQNFTIAHELGHWILHRHLFETHPEKYPVLLRSTFGVKKNAVEQEADNFAANLLVPDRLLRPLKHWPAVTLAQIFSVSVQMMGIRLKNV